ncbi:MAG TPA: signal peptidase II [Firmicutes bacterium]|nr:signal peptidase II [Bacillales bacterium]HJA42026.1 signal peptidase II [Bacillota bacterium]
MYGLLKYKWLYIVLLLVIGIDQLTKWLVLKNMYVTESISIIGEFLKFTSHRNRGAAWGMLEGQFWLFYIVTAIVVGFILYYIIRFKITDFLSLLTFGFIMGGAVGNFLDRFFRGEVVDFIEVNFSFYNRFPIFNIADAALTIGVLLFAFVILTEGKAAKEESVKNGE